MSELQHTEEAVTPEGGRPTPPLGATLRAQREARGESLAGVASALKISVRQVMAMEAERFDELPGPAFVKGFLRNYGRYLGVNVEPMLASYWADARVSDVNLTPVTNAHGTMPVSGASSGLGRASAVIVAALALALALGWYFDGFRLEDEPAAPNEVAEVAEVLDDEATAVARLELPDFAPEGVIESDAQPAAEGAAPIQVAEGEAVTIAAPQAPAAVARSEAAPAVPAQPQPAPAKAPATPAPRTPAVATAPSASASEPAPATAAAPAATGGSRIVFRLRADAWLQVRDAADRTLYAGTSVAGATRVVQGDPPFWVTVGNADAVTLEYNGSPVDLTRHMHTAGVARLVLE